MGLTTTKSERFSACANRSQSHMCRATVSAPVSLSPALRAAPSRCEGADDTRMASGSRHARQMRRQKLPPSPWEGGQGGIGRSMSSRSHRMGLTTTKSERFSVCANRGQSHMCRATASAPVSLSPALRAAPSRWEGADDTRMASGSRYVRQTRRQKLPSSRWAGADDTGLALCTMFFFIDQ